jgi:DNA-binding CsgD family transcriptional regulator
MDGSKHLERILSLMPSAALLIDSRQRVRFANAAAEQLFVARDGLALDRDRRLRAGSPFPAEVASFSRALTEALDVASGDDRRIGEPVNARQKNAKGLQRAFGLTPAEARVASLVASGLNGPQAAKVLGVTPATVKTHLAHSFEKTGTHSQVGLARLISVLPTLD